MDGSDFFKVLKEQTYGAIIEMALLNEPKQKILYETSYESIKEVDEIILETIDFVNNKKNYQYGNKYKPELTTGKKQVLKKLNKLLKEA